MIYLGWTVWILLASYTAVLWFTKLRNTNGGVRFLAGRCAFLLTLALIVSTVPGIPKLHLVWVAPVVYIFSMTWNGMVLDARVKRVAKRAAAESKRTGEPEDAIIQRELKRWGYEPQGSQGAIL